MASNNDETRCRSGAESAENGGKIAGENRGKDVRALHQEIDKFTKSLEEKKSLKIEMDNADKAIASWWERAIKWFKK